MINKKFIKTILLITIVLIFFTSCKKSSATKYEPEGIISEEVIDYDSQTDKITIDDTENQADEVTIYGEVTAILNNEITLSLGTLNTPPEKPEGSNKLPNNQSNDKSGFSKDSNTNILTLSGEEKTITITDESIITLQKTDSLLTGLDAIEVGKTLKIVLTQDSVNNETLTVIDILQ